MGEGDVELGDDVETIDLKVGRDGFVDLHSQSHWRDRGADGVVRSDLVFAFPTDQRLRLGLQTGGGRRADNMNIMPGSGRLISGERPTPNCALAKINRGSLTIRRLVISRATVGAA